MFIHWGLYSAAAGTRNGREYLGIAEWLMHPAMADVCPADDAAPAIRFDPRAADA